ncbi:phage-related protein [Clostridium beijerinckii]|uniref:Phage-related protein n=1 Tax=Clostridium beijerinckii TaxID=1520 RepID=A0AAX0B510_CLOBE|nr:phage tail domain-containing protein [Clostridium beijerinckii]NRT34143.1 phage-related protein [Clostridium beijerinckii]NRT46428.1 phage-related protein [Clostridium beijerinckii]NRT90172.1 phage-related protein [Clostridium beijerinckii]NRZ19568.1 phage-related protein [Clostridium beijerinckii]NYC69702.1 phage-related protein [Clostridium beijerinckii]
MNFIFYNNVDSRDLDLIIENVPIVPATNIEYETIEIDGGENLTRIKGFSDISLSFDFWYKADNDEYFMKKALIDNWLLNTKSKELFYSADESKTYKVKQIKISETKTSSRIIRRFTATFICNGLKYMTSGLKPKNIVTSETTINNFGTYESRPLIKIYGSGNITVSINSSNFTIKNVVDYVTIDSEIKECYKDNINFGRNMTGDYPVFFIGKNTILWSGNVSKLEITPRWRCY